MNGIYWKNTSELDSKSFICGYCGEKISSNVGYYLTDWSSSGKPNKRGYIYICHNCNYPTYIDWNNQVPMYKYGKSFSEKIFPDEKTFYLYDEVRNCYKASAFSSCVLSARKLLMHIAVDCGAEEGKKFIEYVDFLDKNNYIPKNCKSWVDIIRNKGNEATHEIVIFNETDAKQIINFLEIIINVIYAMQYQANLYLSEE
ncbi:MAG: DUF4145 domain-containing protein [bacterium]|nr:DUF4145 domain-containing protein [bacterium]